MHVVVGHSFMLCACPSLIESRKMRQIKIAGLKSRYDGHKDGVGKSVASYTASIPDGMEPSKAYIDFLWRQVHASTAKARSCSHTSCRYSM